MREIKFRTWDGEKMRIVISPYLRQDGSIAHVSVEQDRTCDTLWPEDIENFSMMQYTGLKDKNDKEIYEGDIVRCFGAVEHSVEFMVGAFGYVVNTDKEYAEFISFVGNDNFEWFDYKSGYVEVIGNIYENPELL